METGESLCRLCLKLTDDAVGLFEVKKNAFENRRTRF